jgi:hypothetical protein
MKKKKGVPLIFLMILVFQGMIFPRPSLIEEKKSGYFEIGFHYGTWSVNLLKSTIEQELGNALETELKDPLLDEIHKDYPEIVEKSYSQNIDFNSSGENFGFELRWYPKGRTGSFSMGLSVEKTSMTISIPDIEVIMESTQGHVFQGQGSGEFIIEPVSLHLNFRWDIKPSWKINPYISFGFGIASGSVFDRARVSYSVSGTLVQLGYVLDTYEQAESKTMAELKTDLEEQGGDFFLPDIFPFAQVNIGVKGEVTRNVFLLLDVGIWDGFLFRGGLAFRL